MLFPTPRVKSKRIKDGGVDISEAFVLWDLLNSSYLSLERIQFWENYVHDQDLAFILKVYHQRINGNIKKLEKLLKQFGINGPEPNVHGINTSSNSEVIHDRFIAQDAFLLLQEEIGVAIRVVKNMVTNDRLRKLMIKLALKVVNEFDTIVKYIRVKGWVDIPPVYPNIPSEVEERIDVAQAYALWDHLTYRYDNINQTEMFMEYVYDQDFKLLLSRGREILARQSKILEKELLHFGVPLPQPTSEVIAPPESSEMVRDKYIYRTIWLGMQGASEIHYLAVKKSVVNDRIRHLYANLLKEELNNIDKYVRYGKMKGWIHPAPKYSLA